MSSEHPHSPMEGGSAESPRSGGGRVLVHGLELVDGHEHRAGLRPLTRADDAALLEQVHEASGAGEPDAELALEHRGGAEAAADHELHGLDEEVVAVVVTAATAAAAAPARRITLQALDVLRRLDLAPPVCDRLAHALLVDPRALDALGA